MSKQTKEQVVFQKKYKKPGLGILNHALPQLNHINKDFVVTEAKILEAGLVTNYKGNREYQIIKVYLEKKETPDESRGLG